MKHVTILGTGAMGTRMAKKLLAAGYAVTVFNRTEKHALSLMREGAIYANTPIVAVQEADLVISMLTNDEASQNVWLNEDSGAIGGLKPGAIAVESSTLSATWVDELARECHKRNIEFMDAPVVGSRPQADSGALQFLVGGNRIALDTITPVLSCMSTAIHHVGAIGAGIRMKLAINAFFGIQVSALCEIMGMLEKSGINKANMIGLFNQLPTTSPALQVIGNLIVENNFAPLFPINLVEKDFRYAQDMANTSRAQLPLADTAYRTFQQARERGFGEDNIAAVVRLYV